MSFAGFEILGNKPAEYISPGKFVLTLRLATLVSSEPPT